MTYFLSNILMPLLVTIVGTYIGVWIVLKYADRKGERPLEIYLRENGISFQSTQTTFTIDIYNPSIRSRTAREIKITIEKDDKKYDTRPIIENNIKTFKTQNFEAQKAYTLNGKITPGDYERAINNFNIFDIYFCYLDENKKQEKILIYKAFSPDDIPKQ